MIKNIIFDVGKVLIDWDPYETMEKLKFSKEAIKEITDKVFDSGEWGKEDLGIYTPIEMANYFATLVPEYDKEMRLFYSHATDSIRPRAYVRGFLKSLRAAGYKTYVLSNFGGQAKEKAIELGGINFLDLMDGYLFSYEVHQIKPDVAIYNTLLAKFNLDANECVFIDDVPANIEGAKKVGINGIIFNSFEQVCDDLRKLGVVFNYYD